MFLQAIDTVLAFSMIMLLLSALVTVLVQMFISLFGLRGHNLLFGLRQLVGTVAPDLDQADVETLADKIFKHPALRAGVKRAAVEVNAKEILMVLESLRKGEDLEPKIKATLDELFEQAASESSKLAGSLELLKNLRTDVPERVEAIQKLTDSALASAKEVVVRIDTWFDSSMSHAGERLKLHARWITGFCAVVMAVGLQVDSASLLTQLWSDPEVTTQLVLDAQGALDLYDRSRASEDPSQIVDEIRATLGDTDLMIFGTLSGKDPKWSASSVPGSLLTALLLSLGAPFWYGMVGKIVGFRAAAAGKAKNTDAQT